jgi:hypothetical protein
MRATVQIAIANAVLTQGGDNDDVRDLLDVWRRVERVNGERADRIRAQATKAKAAYESEAAEAWQ